ncbi:MAG: transcriptional regulator NrdR [Ruminococcus sp.]|jgi:transcriptional repressor NrdR|nr:transcriptional regulator NrdR [Ruminococcus sp.]
MFCPFCNEPETKVIDSRTVDRRIKRRRECTACLKRFTTYENYDIIDSQTLLVQKKNGTVEMFNRAKIIAGISGAIKKRPVTAEQIERIADGIEERLTSVRGKTFTTSQIGDMVLEQLAALDNVAYIRFASVYKDFDSADSFVKIISESFPER